MTNGLSAIAGAQANDSPICVLGGRAPEMRWGSGSLQEIDHLPFVSPLVKSAQTVKDPGRIAAMTAAALDLAAAGAERPDLRRLPARRRLHRGRGGGPGAARRPARRSRPRGSSEAAALLAGAERPVIMAGTGLYWGRGEEEMRALAEALGIPVFLNGLGRGCLPADHELAFSRARGTALQGADVALVIGVPMDFRLGFGGSFGEETKIVRLDVAPNALERQPRARRRPGRRRRRRAWRRSARRRARPGAARAWVEQLRQRRGREARRRSVSELDDPRSPLHPVRVYRELGEVLDRDAIVVGDGGDFVSYAGRFIDTYQPGCWMDPGPFGCLGAGPGQAIGAKVAHPDRQVCLLLGDGAFGFAGMEFDTMARHGLGVVGVMGNNGIWALEHHPMKFLYGYSVAAELRPETRYDELVESLGCDGILVREPGELRPALERAFASGRPTLVNVLTDPEVVYPRKSNLA